MQDDTQIPDAEEVIQEPTEYSAEEIEKMSSERKTAITEAIENNKEAKTAKAEANYYKKMTSVQRNPDYLTEIHMEDPEMANKLAQELYSKSYDQLLAEARGETTPNVDVNKLVDAKFAQREREAEVKRIDKLEDKFFEDNKITLGSEEYNKILKIYKEYPKNTLEQASGLLEMAYMKVKGKTNPVIMNNTPPTPSNAPSSSQRPKSKKPEPTPEQMEVMKGLGITLEEFQNS